MKVLVNCSDCGEMHQAVGDFVLVYSKGGIQTWGIEKLDEEDQGKLLGFFPFLFGESEPVKNWEEVQCEDSEDGDC